MPLLVYSCPPLSWAQEKTFLPDTLWETNFEDGFHDYLRTILATPDGGYLLGGSSNSNNFYDSTAEFDFWIAKVDANGQKLWEKYLGGTENDFLNEMVICPDGGYLLGGYSQSGIGDDKTESLRGKTDFWVVKVDEEGNKLWDKTYGGSEVDLLIDMQVSPDGGILLAGMSDSNISGDKTVSNIDMGIRDRWILKIDKNGNKLWEIVLDGQPYGFIASNQVASFRDGNYGSYEAIGLPIQYNFPKLIAIFINF
ncbi:MAG: hypothetical protein AAFU64_13750 [Bacteroidota bacterium]